MRATRTDAGKGRSPAWWALAATAVVTIGAFVGAGPWGSTGSAGPSAGVPLAPGTPLVPALTPAAGSLAAGAVSPASARIDPGETVTLSASASGGTSPYEFDWYSGTFPQCSGDVETGTSLGSGREVNVSSAAPSAYYCYTVTDSEVPPASSTPSAAALVTVNATLVAGAAGPGPLTIDAGKALTLTSAPSGGVPPYVVNWFSNATGSSSCLIAAVGSGSTVSVTPSQNTSYCYVLTDTSVGTPAASAQSAPLAITVDPKLVAGAIAPAGPTIDSGRSVVLTAAPSGGAGAGSYTLQWYAGTSTSCPTGKAVGPNSATYSLPALTSTTQYCYSVVDTSYGSTATYSAVDTVTVKGSLTAGPVTPTSPGVDLGQTITLTAAAGSGDPPYSYQWYYSTYPTCSATTATPIVGQYNNTYTFVPGTSEYLCYAASDNSTGPPTVFSPGDLLTVNAPPVANAISPLTPTLDAGQHVHLTANPADGTPAYVYSWYDGLNSSCAGDLVNKLTNTTSSIWVAPTSPTYYCYEVADSSKGTPAMVAYSSTDYVAVNLALVANPITPTAPTIDSGQSLILTSNAVGGTPVYAYLWYSGSGCKQLVAGQTNATVEVEPTSNTTYCYSVSDGSANPPTKLSAADAVVVESALLPGAVTPLAPSLDSGQKISLNATPTGGKPPYSYVWYNGSSPTCADDTNVVGAARNLVLSPTASMYLCYGVTDSLATPAHVNSTAALLTVNPALAPGPITSASAVIDKGQSAQLFATPTDGTPTYREEWYTGTSSNCSNDTTKVSATTGSPANITVSPATLGAVYYCFTVLDSSSGYPSRTLVSASYAVTVDAALVIGAPIPLIGQVPTPGPISITRGQDVVLVANVSGGTPPVSYAWYESPTSKCSAASSKVLGADLSTYNFTPTASAYYCVGVTDQSTGSPATPYFSPAEQVTVNPPPGPSFLGFPAVEGYEILGGLLGFFALIGFLVYLRVRGERGRRGPHSDFL